ncbi:hypothetical protein MTR67_035312 [Solanum verrucosum]|uniref:Reverse transcriptase zinc-binding domain-containing protein n=1 Tax=Solanum verrucosum TaxID=315347 RepID=A0AAF0ZK61_SOLVR|nr:hypothetical protein MTR67_035312 [Solanum verrucosum]
MAPVNVKCFTWLVVKRAWLTHEVLQKKGRIVVTICFLCNETWGDKQPSFFTFNVYFTIVEPISQPHKY